MSSACDNSACKQTLEQHKSAAKHYAEEAAELHAKYLAEISILREELEKKDEIITNLNRVVRHKDRTLEAAHFEARVLQVRSRDLQYQIEEGYKQPRSVSPRRRDHSE